MSGGTHRRQRRPFVPVALVAVVGAALVLGLLIAGVPHLHREPAAADRTPVAAVPAGAHLRPRSDSVGRARRILTAWDRRRAAAWAASDAVAVRALYLSGSPLARRETSALRRWQERGLRLRGLHAQIVRLQVRSLSGTRLRAVLVTRTSGATRVMRGGRVVGGLPDDAPRRLRVELRRVDGVWVMARSEAA